MSDARGLKSGRDRLTGAVVVLGMHRSGTSALTRGLTTLGISLGDNLKPPVAGDNDKGFFEDWALSTINDEILELERSRWDSLLVSPQISDAVLGKLKLKAVAAIAAQFGASKYFAFKDPRTCRTLPFWKDVLRREGLRTFYVIAFRNPMAVAWSLEARNQFPRIRSYYLWLLHYLNAVRLTEGEPRIFVEFDDLIADPKAVLTGVRDLVGDPEVNFLPKELLAYEAEFLDEAARHHLFKPSDLELDSACPAIVRGVYDLLRTEKVGNRGVAAGDWARAYDAFNAIASFSELPDLLERASAAKDTHIGQLIRIQDDLSAKVDHAERATDALSSRVTALEFELATAKSAADAAENVAHQRQSELDDVQRQLAQALEQARSDVARLLFQIDENGKAAAAALEERIALARQESEQAAAAHSEALERERRDADERLRQLVARERSQHAALLTEVVAATEKEAAATLQESLAAAEAAHLEALERERHDADERLRQLVAREQAQHAALLAEVVATREKEAAATLRESLAAAREAFEEERAEAAAQMSTEREDMAAELGAVLDANAELSKLHAEKAAALGEALHVIQEFEQQLRIEREQEERRKGAHEARAVDLEKQLDEARRRQSAGDALIAHLSDSIRAIHNSTSWKITHPMRALKTFLQTPLVAPQSRDVRLRAEASDRDVVERRILNRRRIHFTICAKNYLPIARACLQSSMLHHPDAEHVLVLCDEIDQGYDPAREPFRVVSVHDVGIETLPDMIVRYDVMELSTAIKPFCIRHFFEQGAGEVVYLDPDLYFLSPLDAVREAFDAGIEAVVTPHINFPIADDKRPSDRDMLRVGVFNLGFLALRRTDASVAFVNWWAERLRMGAVSDLDHGLFTDQKWCDLLPCFVPKTLVLHEPGYNVAYWNLMHRVVQREGSAWTAAGKPICFLHFSGASFSDQNVFSKHQNRYDANSIGHLRELYDLYRDKVRANGFGVPPNYLYSFDRDERGRCVAPILRQMYREEIAPGAPLESPSVSDIVELANQRAPSVTRHDGLLITRLMHRIWNGRPDLQSAFDLRTDSGQRDFVAWGASAMEREYGLDASIFPIGIAEGREDATSNSNSQFKPVSELSKAVLAGAPSLRPLYRHLPENWRHRVKVALARAAYSNQTSEAPLETPAPGAALIGYARGELGMGEHVRMTAAALQSRSIPLGIVNISENVVARQEDTRFDHLIDQKANFRANIFHINADQLPMVCAKLGSRFLAERTNIAYPAWELASFPAEWAPQLEVMDEIWAPSRFVQQAIAERVRRPVVHMPLAVDLAAGYEKWTREDFAFPKDAFIFLFYFDLASFSTRKNPIAAVEAFQRAFPRGCKLAAEPLLVVKVMSAERFPAEFARLQAIVANTPNAILMSDVLSADRMHGLVNSADAFISLHRSEGFGRGPAEAMLLGKAVIATGYSGNMDYMNGGNSFPVSYRMRAVSGRDYPFGAGQLWAEPDVAEAADIMRRLADNPSIAHAIGMKARAYMQTHHQPAEIGRRYAERLKVVGAIP